MVPTAFGFLGVADGEGSPPHAGSRHLFVPAPPGAGVALGVPLLGRTLRGAAGVATSISMRSAGGGGVIGRWGMKDCPANQNRKIGGGLRIDLDRLAAWLSRNAALKFVVVLEVRDSPQDGPRPFPSRRGN